MRLSPKRTPIAKLRMKHGVMQKILATELGVSQSHLKQVELGKRQSKSLLKRAREYFALL